MTKIIHTKLQLFLDKIATYLYYYLCQVMTTSNRQRPHRQGRQAN